MTAYRTSFISHAHADNRLCAAYYARLGALGVDAWMDLSNLQDGHMLSSDITYELVRRQAFVLLLTAASNASHWVGQELDTYIAYARDGRTRLLDGVERLIIPVLLEANLPMIVRDTVTGQNVASNWAKVFGLKAIDATSLTPEQTADAIAHAVQLPAIAPRSPVPALSAPPFTTNPNWAEITIPARLDHLGFAGWRDKQTTVSFIVPPTVSVAAGRFTMGSAADDPQAYAQEKPEYTIPVAAFRLGTYQVTVVEYDHYLRANPKVTLPPDWEAFKSAAWLASWGWRGMTLTWALQQAHLDNPVACVTWFNARDYAAWLAQVTGQPWRLPTEAEWEKAARWDVTQGHARVYPWGDQWDAARANTQEGNPRWLTTSVGAYAEQGDASPYEVHDMAGNVREWQTGAHICVGAR